MNVVAYVRVSTGAQGKSGLGLDAQRELIARFAATNGFTVVAEHQEVESGKGADALERRPMLREHTPASFGDCCAGAPVLGCRTAAARQSIW